MYVADLLGPGTDRSHFNPSLEEAADYNIL
jgi:hypothetical protein